MIFFSFTAVAVLASRQYNLVVESGVGVWGEKNKCLIFFKLKQHLAHVFTSGLHHSFLEVGIKVIKEMTRLFSLPSASCPHKPGVCFQSASV